MLERDIEDYLVKRVKELGGEVRKVQWIGRRGAPDRLVLLPPIPYGPEPEGGRYAEDWEREPGWSVWVELKAPGVKAEAHQLREHQRMQAMGQRVAVLDSLKGVDEVLS